MGISNLKVLQNSALQNKAVFLNILNSSLEYTIFMRRWLINKNGYEDMGGAIFPVDEGHFTTDGL